VSDAKRVLVRLGVIQILREAMTAADFWRMEYGAKLGSSWHAKEGV
jgi:hypothetical protein